MVAHQILDRLRAVPIITDSHSAQEQKASHIEDGYEGQGW